MFDTVTAASPWEIPAAKRTQLLGGAFALHALAVLVYLFAAVWTIRPVAPPDLVDAFVRDPAPPRITFDTPAPAARIETTAPAAGPRAGAAIDSARPDLQPNGVAELAPANGIETISVAGLDGFIENEESGPDGATASTGDGEASLAYHSGMAAPGILFRTNPIYPELARRLHKEGTVVIEAEIGRDGLLRSARAVNPPLGFGLEEAALSALAGWRFSPALLNGRPVSVFYRLSVNFTLR